MPPLPCVLLLMLNTDTQCVANILFFFPRALASSSAPASSTTTSYPDIVTSALANVLQQLWPEVQLDAVARATRHVSLVFVGVIILSSVRRVLRGVTRVRMEPLPLAAFISSRIYADGNLPPQALRLPGRTAGASLMLLLLAQIMVSPCIASLISLGPPRSLRVLPFRSATIPPSTLTLSSLTYLPIRPLP